MLLLDHCTWTPASIMISLKHTVGSPDHVRYPTMNRANSVYGALVPVLSLMSAIMIFI